MNDAVSLKNAPVIHPDGRVSGARSPGRINGPGPEPSQAPLARVATDVVADLTMLMRQEIALAKAETTRELSTAGKGAAALGAAGFAGYMVLLFGTVAAFLAIAVAIPIAWAALTVTAGWALIAAVLGGLGATRLRKVKPVPEETIATLKEDARWLTHRRS
jgi:hypothetical protein